MTNEEIQRVMEFIIKQQESFAEGMAQAESRISRLETATVGLYSAMTELAKSQLALTERVSALADKVSDLADAQAHTDQRVNALIDILDQRRNGGTQT